MSAEAINQWGRSNHDLALGYLRRADPVLARLIDAHPDFDPRAWRTQLPPLDAFGALLFQVMGQQLSVPSTRAILRRVQALFGGRLPTPSEYLGASPEDMHGTGLSRRKVATVRAVAEEFAAGRLLPVQRDASARAQTLLGPVGRVRM